MRTITLIPGDGIGPEVTEAVLRIFVAAGHNMLGLLLSPATADAVVGLLDDQPPETIRPFRIDRLPRWLARPVR